jgi:hypothetical protein
MADGMFTDEMLLRDLKIDLGISATIYDERLTARIYAARERIESMGIQLSESEGDRDLLLMYAAYLWRCRATQAPMGRMLQLALNNRLFGQTAAEATTPSTAEAVPLPQTPQAAGGGENGGEG